MHDHCLEVRTRVRYVHRSVHSLPKRGLDIVGSLIGIMTLLMMAMPIAIAIAIDSPGPIFYRQTRCGVGGRRFKIYKFRSMVVDADALKHSVKNESTGFIFKNAQDPRITRVGRFLRRTSLDELPQFWNVLRGEMSLVGTRPPTLDEVQYYSDLHWQRLRVKPGLTGEWQISGRSNVKSFEEVVNLDLRYQASWTIWYDIQILFKTVIILLRCSGSC